MSTVASGLEGTDSPKRASQDAAVELGFASSQIIQEFYYDTDCDEVLRATIETQTGEKLVDESYDDVVDGAILWWRDDDGEVEDLTDLLVDAAANLDDVGGIIWVFTPKATHPGSVAPATVEEAADTAGLRATSTKVVGPDWLGIRLTSRGRGR